MLTTTEAATVLNLKRRQVLKLIRQGKLAAQRFGRDWQVDRASVETYKQSPHKPGRPKKAEQPKTGA